MKKHASTKLHPLEFEVFRAPPEFSGDAGSFRLESGEIVLLACSGGADSLALAEVLRRLASRWKFELQIAYVDHGKSSDPRIQRYRARAQNFVARYCVDRRIGFVKLSDSAHTRPATSEEELREIRQKALSAYMRDHGIRVLALGHHAGDLLETRLIRLIRGTGPQGFVSMKAIDSGSGQIQGLFQWRPLLKFWRSDLEAYLKVCPKIGRLGATAKPDLGLKWVEDPTNRDVRYLRNAVRHRVLPQFEKARPGGVRSMARSFDLVSDFLESHSVANPEEKDELDRRKLLKKSPTEQRLSLAAWGRAQGLRGFSKSRIDEVLKRIDTRRARLTFNLCGRVWLVDETIRLS